MDDAPAVKQADKKGLGTAGKHNDVLVNLRSRKSRLHLIGPFCTPRLLLPHAAAAEPRWHAQLYVRCMELANAYTEPNDPITQERPFANNWPA